MSGVLASTGGAKVRLSDGRTIESARPGRRFAARLMDMALLAPAMLLYIIFLLHVSTIGFADMFESVNSASKPAETDRLVALLGWVGLLAAVLYEPLMVARWGATVGKLAVGIRVVRFADGGQVPAGRSWIRALLPTTAGALTLGVGWFAVWFVLECSMTRRRGWRGWHDSLAGTVVVVKASVSPARASGTRPARASPVMDARWRRFMDEGAKRER